MTLRVDNPQIAQLRQTVDEVADAQAIVLLAVADVGVAAASADPVEHFFEITLADLECLEHLDGMLLHDVDGALQPVFRVDDVLVI